MKENGKKERESTNKILLIIHVYMNPFSFEIEKIGEASSLNITSIQYVHELHDNYNLNKI